MHIYVYMLVLLSIIKFNNIYINLHDFSTGCIFYNSNNINKATFIPKVKNHITFGIIFKLKVIRI